MFIASSITYGLRSEEYDLRLQIARELNQAIIHLVRHLSPFKILK